MATEKRKMHGVVTIYTIGLAVIFVVLFIIGIVGAAITKSFAALSVGLIILSLLGICFCALGFLGLQFSNKSLPLMKYYIPTYFGGIIALHVMFMFICFAAFGISPSLSFIPTMEIDEITKIFKGIKPQDLLTIVDYVAKIQKGMTLVAVFALVVSLLCLGQVALFFFYLKMDRFLELFMASSSILVLILGLFISIFLLVVQPYNMKFGGVTIFPSWIYVIVIVFGFIMSAVGGCGLFATFFGKTHKIVSIIYLVATLTLTLVFLILFIISLCIQGPYVKTMENMCNADPSVEPEVDCNKILSRLKVNTCGYITDPDKKQQCENSVNIQTVTTHAKNMIRGYLGLLSWILIYLTIFLGAVIACTALNAFRKTPDSIRYDNLGDDAPTIVE
ncbi:hypothetical protein BLNAU_21504 [Blattamonas nauphoetae]|uniref:Uncharacterized protein n=1 Tax=Blattamonas nauphoetae TaxID=2049346 RepID=A0ABQ9WW70_9EUKA|nr:hypothetical protein BLNAU_21504 [Blattamonas nauphoetae]